MWPFRPGPNATSVEVLERKFLDASRDPIKRLRTFKHLLDKLSQPKRKPFFEKHPEAIFYVFYSSFTSLEAHFQTKSARKTSDTGFTELTACVLPMLEMIIILLPERLQAKWQYNSVCAVVHKLLHPENILSLRCYGVKLLVLFLLAVQDAAEEDCLELFATAVPGFPPPLITERGQPLEQSEESSSSAAMHFGSYATGESGSTTWWDTSPGVGGVGIARVKPLYPETIPALLKTPRTRHLTEVLLQTLTAQVGRLQWADPSHHIRGFAHLFYQFTLHYLTTLYGRPRDTLYRRQEGGSALPEQEAAPRYDTHSPLYHEVRHQVLDRVLKWLCLSSHKLAACLPPLEDLPLSASLSASYPAQVDGVELVKQTLLSTADNVQLLLEMFRQSFDLPVHYRMPHQVVRLYIQWIQAAAPPLFMREAGTECDEKDGVSWEVLRPASNIGHKDAFYMSHDGIVDRSSFTSHLELCREAIRLYRIMAQQWLLSEEGWLHLLQTLLKVAGDLLQGEPPSGGTTNLASELAQPLLKTIFVCFVRASIALPLPPTLWDSLQQLLEQRTQWRVVLTTWQTTVDHMTQVLCQVLYSVDLKCLPLEQMEQRARPRTHARPSNQQGEFPNQPDREVSPPPSPSARTVGRRWSIRRPRYSPADHPASRVPAHNPTLVKVTSTSASILDQSFDIPSPTTSVPCESTSIASLKDKPTPIRQGSGGSSTGTFPQSSLTVTSFFTPSLSRRELSPNAGPLRKTVSEHMLSTGSWTGHTSASRALPRSPDVGGSPLEPCLESSFAGQGLQREAAEEEWKSSPPPISEHIVRDDSSEDNEGRGSGSEGEGEGEEEEEEEEQQNFASGWNSVVATTVWLRVLGILGDVSHLPHPLHRQEAMKHIQKTWTLLEKVEHNSGVSLDNQTTPTLPLWLPPLLMFAPWSLSSCQPVPSADWLACRQVGHELLCRMFVRHWLLPPDPTHLSAFYHQLNTTLNEGNQEMTAAIIRHTSKLYSCQLPGATLLVPALLMGCEQVLQGGGAHTPRFEALVLLGSILHHVDSSEQKDAVLSLLVRTAHTEPHVESRCLCLYQLGTIVATTLEEGQRMRHLTSIVNVMVASAAFANETVAMAAIDVLSMWSAFAPELIAVDSSLASSVILGLCRAAIDLLADRESPLASNLLVTLVMCLRDWAVATPLEWLLSNNILSHAICTLEACIAPLGHLPSPPVPTSTVQVELGPVRPTHRHKQSSSGGSSRVPFDAVDSGDNCSSSANAVAAHLVTFLDHFPFLSGPAQLTSSAMEHYSFSHHGDEISDPILNSPRLQFFMLNDSTSISLDEVVTPPCDSPPGFDVGQHRVQAVIRTLTGKACWQALPLTAITATPTPPQETIPHPQDGTRERGVSWDSYQEVFPPEYGPLEWGCGARDQPPSWTSAPEGDILDELLLYLSDTSPECLLFPGQLLNVPAPCPTGAREAEERLFSELLEEQEQCEMEHWSQHISNGTVCLPVEEQRTCPKPLPFSTCRQFLSHFGWLDLQKRVEVDLLQRGQQLTREIKRLDSPNSQSRQIYKMAVLYVAPGQEDLHSILSNAQSSLAFEQFVSGLGWEVQLGSHPGYLGGLTRAFAQDMTVPYFASSSEEILFHVSTRMQVPVEQKIRHLGNDEVHVVWSEHSRDYRKSIFKTQFADVLIVLYPQPSGLCRVHIISKPKVGPFGPLYDGAVVPFANLAQQVRATAVNASLRMRKQKGLNFKGRYLERQRDLADLSKNSKRPTTFEEFCVRVVHTAIGRRPLSPHLSAPPTTRHGNATPTSPTPSNNREQPLPSPPPEYHRRRANTYSGTTASSPPPTMDTEPGPAHKSSLVETQ